MTTRMVPNISNASYDVMDRLGRNVTDISEFMVAHDNVNRYVTPFMYTIGFPGNVISLLVWAKRNMRQSSGCYLAALGLVDIVFLALHVVYEIHNVWQIPLLNMPLVCEVFPVVFLWMQYLSPMLVLGFTVERYISVCHPFKRETLCTTTRAVKVIILMTTTAFTVCIIQAYFYTYNPRSGVCDVRQTVTENGSASIWSIWTWITEMLVFLVIPVAVLGFNLRVISEARRLNRETQSRLRSIPRKSSATTLTLLTVSFVLIFTTLPVTITTCVYYSFQEGDPTLSRQQIYDDVTWSRFFTYVLIRAIIHEIGLTHYACNFIIYYVTSNLFRHEVHAMLTDKLCVCLRKYEWSRDNYCCNNLRKTEHSQKHRQTEENTRDGPKTITNGVTIGSFVTSL